MKYIFSILIVFFSHQVFSIDIFEYENTKGNEKYSTSLAVSPIATGYEIFVKLEKTELRSIVSETYEIRTLAYSNPGENSNLLITRKGNAVEITGTVKNSPVNEIICISDFPWHQFPELTFSDFILSNKVKLVYWTFVGYNRTMMKLGAEKVQVEKITINGRDEEAWRVLVKPEGIYALFWHADFWFRKSDGAYLKFEAIDGIGEPVTFMEFKKKIHTD